MFFIWCPIQFEQSTFWREKHAIFFLLSLETGVAHLSRITLLFLNKKGSLLLLYKGKESHSKFYQLEQVKLVSMPDKIVCFLYRSNAETPS